MVESRMKKATKNIIYGISYQIIVLVLSFVSRSVFIHILGIEYLGINGLYSNIIQVLSLADLGLANAMTFSLYKPLHENNKIEIASLMNFYKKIYFYIAFFVAFFGLLLVPFLQHVVNINKEFANIEIFYLLFLSNSVVSYLFISKSTIIIADRKNYLIKRYSLIFETLKSIVQVVILFIFKNYGAFLIIQILTTLLKNMYIANKSNSLYPYINNKQISLNKSVEKNILQNVKSMFIYKIGGVILNNTDNILISTMVGTIYVGVYSNYVLIVNGIKGFVDILFTSITASVGNLNVKSDSDNEERSIRLHSREKVYDTINFVAFWIYGLCSICLYNLLNDFIILWIGKEYILSNINVLVIVLNFYIPGSLSGTILFRDTTGLFRQTKFIFLITAIINLFLSLILGKYFGLLGILFATLIARLITIFWYEPYMLYKFYFNKNMSGYISKQLLNLSLIIIANLFITPLEFEITGSNLLNFVMKMSYCIIVVNALFIFIFRKTDEYVTIKNKLKLLIH